METVEEKTQSANSIISLIGNLQDVESYRELHWEGTFEEYLNIVKQHPKVARNAFQRIYDMILSYGTEEIVEQKEKLIKYKFFEDPIDNGRDAVYGLERSLMKIVSLFKSAAKGYGTEKRVFLLHGPVGSAKSTIVRLLKKGLEAYSWTKEGALFSYAWKQVHNGEVSWIDCPMHEEPLHLIPEQFRAHAMEEFNKGRPEDQHVKIVGELCPFCRQTYRELLRKYAGDWTKVIADVKVRRLLLSEKDRIGIGTFQPKDEKNQDSTELTGDINYRKIAEYGSDSDPRAFNFDGEFNIANRGIVEFIEVLKL
ncbi:MAG: serine/threonine protein kinase, partial [candidate division KSB1 bacterium]|nr:serine/threonine protein kinase [candidate division KSB1 bacterium]